ncbi:putative RNA-directed DNA polymerase from transposon BS [Stylophora pistillata]|uniref:Putative RNA-directed DNA polymerase from transposon BS n=1 Tax=Stylophora pistillata TaxID=50429 RepID=A0A2B4S934_STYPI|nr:putative RNA-directed DNA polymerase from transposon BS [Stylophora pistillata]
MLTRRHRSEDFIVLKENDRIIRDQSEVAETFNEYFTNITKDLIIYDHSAFSDQTHLKRIPEVNNEAANVFSFRFTNHHVLKMVVEDFKTNKPQEYDFFPPQAVKASSGSIAKPLSDLVNTIITTVLDNWKRGQITPLHKMGSALDKTNFRPVTVLPAFSKVFEKIIHMQLTEHFKSIFHDYLFAYRRFHSCPTALLALTEDWRAELDKHNITGTVAIDLSKAFDCLPHDLLLEKLNFYGLEKNSVSLLRSYLSSRYQRVKLGNTFATWMGVHTRVPQGSLLGPLLFNIFMNDLVFAVENCRLLSYADETKLYLSHHDPRALEEDMTPLWGKEYKENGKGKSTCA